MSFLVDSQVVVYALMHAAGETPGENCGDMPWRSYHLLDNAEFIRMSAVSWFEIQRVAREQRGELLKKWESRIHILAFDNRVATRAASLMDAARKSSNLCPRCLGLVPHVVCRACGSQRSKQQRTHDIFIVASAAVHPKIRTLYSFDGGVRTLGNFVDTEVDVREPPAVAQQLPLEGTIPIREGNRPPQRRRKKGS